MMALLLVSLAASADPCAVVAPAAQPDKATAEIYEGIGDQEVAASNTDAAIYAYQHALSLDPTRGHARVALLSLCRTGEEDDYFQSAMTRLEAGDKAGAIATLREGQQSRPDSTAALVEGVTLYELGRDSEARTALERALSNEELADSARLFLGLIAVRADDEQMASSLLTQASLSEDAQVRNRAQLALRSLRRTSWLSLDVSAGGGFDSNPGLSPSGQPLPGGDWDNYAAVTAAAQWAPLGASTPFALAGGAFRKQFVLAAFDLGDGYVGGGYQWTTPTFGLRGQYLFDFVEQGGDGYLVSHRGSATGWWNIGRATLSGGYTLTNEAFVPQDLGGFSGWRHDVEGLVGLDLDRLQLSLGYAVSRDLAVADTWSYLEHGPELLSSFQIIPRLSAGLEGLLSLRSYDQPLNDPQHDLGIRARVNLTWWFLDAFGLRASFSYWRNISNLPDFTTTRLLFALDLLYALRMR